MSQTHTTCYFSPKKWMFLTFYQNSKFNIIIVSFNFFCRNFSLPFQCCPLYDLIRTMQSALFFFWIAQRKDTNFISVENPPPVTICKNANTYSQPNRSVFERGTGRLEETAFQRNTFLYSLNRYGATVRVGEFFLLLKSIYSKSLY